MTRGKQYDVRYRYVRNDKPLRVNVLMKEKLVFVQMSKNDQDELKTELEK